MGGGWGIEVLAPDASAKAKATTDSSFFPILISPNTLLRHHTQGRNEKVHKRFDEREGVKEPRLRRCTRNNFGMAKRGKSQGRDRQSQSSFEIHRKN